MAPPPFDAVAFLSALVSIPSPSHRERAVADHLAAWFAARGLTPERIGDNLVLRTGPRDGRALLLCSHLDTVPATDAWTRDPFTPEVVTVGGRARLHGLGANDAGASVTAMTAAFLALHADADVLPGPLVLALVAEEETGGAGNLESVLPALPPLAAALVGEPTSLDLAVAQKGLMVLEVTTRGTGCHAANAPSREPPPDNAVLLAALDLLAVNGVRFPRADARLGPTTFNVTTIAGGDAHNRIPEACMFTIDVRTTPAYSHAEVRERFARAVRGELRARSERLVPVRTPDNHPLVAACQRARPAARLYGSPTMSDMVFLSDVPVVKVGPGVSALSHVADEYVELSWLAEGAALYEAAIREYLPAWPR